MSKLRLTLFKNNYKQKEAHPDYNVMYSPDRDTKAVKVGGAWKKETKKGDTFLSVQLELDKITAAGGSEGGGRSEKRERDPF